MPEWPVSMIMYGGYVLLAVIAVIAYRIGKEVGMRAADHRWTGWTGAHKAELEQRTFERELREFRRRIGRPADDWPEQMRED